jgi:tetratricopeptide (TPR) repeat protein
MDMVRNMTKTLGSLILMGVFIGGTSAWAQAPAQQTAPPAQTEKPKGQVEPLTLNPAAPPVNAEEDAAIKAFRAMPNEDLPKKLQAAIDFLQKYPNSRYRLEVYSWQVKGYLSAGDVPKMEAAAQKDLELSPNDAQTMAILGSAMPRSMASNLTEEQKDKLLTQAEQYSNKAIELLPTIPKPDGMSDELFIGAKNQTLSMAYSGLGLVAFRRGKYADAIPNLEKALKLDANPDPVNYFVLGLANEKASHFDDAVTAFTKCAAIQSGLQPTCKQGVEEAKKLGATQLSVPK